MRSTHIRGGIHAGLGVGEGCMTGLRIRETVVLLGTGNISLNVWLFVGEPSNKFVPGE